MRYPMQTLAIIVAMSALWWPTFAWSVELSTIKPTAKPKWCARVRQPASEKSPAAELKDGQMVTRQGKLVDSLNVGGESTGWVLIIGKGEKASAMDVDMSEVANADIYDGTQVTITGTMHLEKYVERGETWILKAKTVKRK